MPHYLVCPWLRHYLVGGGAYEDGDDGLLRVGVRPLHWRRAAVAYTFYHVNKDKERRSEHDEEGEMMIISVKAVVRLLGVCVCA